MSRAKTPASGRAIRKAPRQLGAGCAWFKDKRVINVYESAGNTQLQTCVTRLVAPIYFSTKEC